MRWWILELAVTLLLAVVAVVLGTALRRSGKAYAADVFAANPRTGKSFLLLMDFAYYLIFGAFILFTISYQPDSGWGERVTAAQVESETVRMGGGLLMIGLLHGLNVLALPIIGRMLNIGRRSDQEQRAT